MKPPLPSFSVLKRAGQPATALNWNARGRGPWWLSPLQHTLTTWNLDTGQRLQAALPDAGYTFCPTACGRVLIGLSKRLCLAELPARSGARPAIVNWLATVDAIDHRTAIGNGRADHHGRFVFGTRNMSPDGHAIGSFYQYCPQSGLRRLALPTVVAASCIGVDLAGTRLYFADAAAGVLYRCDYDSATATTSNVVPFAQADHGAGMRDALVDGEHGVWTAQAGPGGSKIVRYRADGTPDQVIAAPRHPVTGLSFYGAGLRQLLLVGETGGWRLVDGLDVHGQQQALFDDRAIAVAASQAFAPD